VNFSLLKRPSAYLPILMSLAGLGLVLGHVAVYGIVHEVDEGTPAHIFQLLMALQAPILIFFAAKWLPRAPRKAIPIMCLQAIAVAAAFAAVFFLTD
jgi:MFS superfamily sulfate permease-like transporter